MRKNIFTRLSVAHINFWSSLYIHQIIQILSIFIYIHHINFTRAPPRGAHKRQGGGCPYKNTKTIPKAYPLLPPQKKETPQKTKTQKKAGGRHRAARRAAPCRPPRSRFFWVFDFFWGLFFFGGGERGIFGIVFVFRDTPPCLL